MLSSGRRGVRGNGEASTGNIGGEIITDRDAQTGGVRC